MTDEPVTEPPENWRTACNRQPACLVMSIVALIVVAGCLDSRTPTPPVPGPSAGSPPAQIVDASAPPAPPSATPSPDDELLFAEDDGLRLAVTLDANVVAPGGTLVVTATIRNNRPRAVILGSAWCGAAADVTAALRIPIEPVGRAWGGIEGAWKKFAIASGMAPGGGPAIEDVAIHGTSGRGCGEGTDQTLGPGEILSVSSRINAEIVPGVPALPGDVPLRISILHDPQDPTPAIGPPANDRPANRRDLRIGPSFSQLTVETTFRVEGDAPRLLSLGEAVDALLVDRRFATWLATMPPRTWSGSNLFLQNNGRAEGIVPAGPSWEIDLFREVGVPRNWAIGFVDPFDGTVLNLAFCNVPCDR